MYMITQAERVVPIPPARLSENIEDVIDELTWKQCEGQFGPDKSITVLVKNVRPKGPGRIVHGDGSVYQTVEFDQLVFKFKENEIVEGYVAEITRHGAFIKFGPLDGLLYIGQIMDDHVDVDEQNKRLVGKDSGRSLSVGDVVRARIVGIDVNEKNPQESRIALVTRGQVGLGKLEWIEEDEKKRSVA